MKLSSTFIALFLAVFIQSSFQQQGLQQIPESAIPPAKVTAHSSSRMNRLHHNLFHNIRMNWALLDELEQKQIADLGWKPEFISFTYLDHDINQPVTLYGPTGEDFLFMHRRMINEVNRIAEEAESDWRVRGWEACPDPSDEEWPVPEVPDVGNDDYAAYLNYYKTDQFYANVIEEAEDWIENEDNLRTMTLGEFGVKVEYELHTYFHVRFSAYNPIGYRMQDLHPTTYIDEMWDDPQYNYLADFYSAHVNPTFWKIHGWIEDRISDWQEANGVDLITWTSTWEKGPMDEGIIKALAKIGSDAKKRANAPASTNNSAEIYGSIVGAFVVCVVIVLVGYYFMDKLLYKEQNYAKVPKSAASGAHA